MSTDRIKEIGIDEQERLYVIPQGVTFPAIYREAMEVHWDVNHQYLYAPKPREWSRLDWYKQIVSAAEKQGCVLMIYEGTRWVNIPDDLKAEIHAWSEGSWR